MFALFAFFPLAYALLAAYSGFPLREQKFDKNALQNESLFVFLELNLTDIQQFNFFVSSGQVNVKRINICIGYSSSDFIYVFISLIMEFTFTYLVVHHYRFLQCIN